MDFVIWLGIAIGLAMDAFAVAVAASIALRKVSPRQVFRFGWHFGLFQAMMPIIGWWAGRWFQRFIEAFDHWVAFGLLCFVGGKMIYESFQAEEETVGAAIKDPTRGWSLVMYSFATSIDALAVGLSLAMLDVSIWIPALTIGVITAALTSVGMILGGKIGELFGRRMEIVGGIILIGIGLKTLLQDLLQ
ncbi:MAG: putative manganese efflux pump MntP [candidate division BRC1 bacterium ADurb.BinA364]|nr:MAG: putative manganese efflux pump MntP [candidate division BRC1 bacterium ADurb.BinA364]